MQPPSQRLRSLDVFRGATIAAMILVNNPGDWGNVYPPLLHAAWHGWTPTDLIFPFFLFILGVAIPYSVAGRLQRTGGDRRPLITPILRRSTVLLALGLGLSWFPYWTLDWSTARWPGVLQRIAIVYLVAALTYLFARVRGAATLAVLLLLGHWSLLALVPVPGHGAGGLGIEDNLAAWIDHLLLGAHTWRGAPGPGDPEGLLSTLPAIASVLAGVLTGVWLRSSRRAGVKLVGLFFAGNLCLVLGSAWSVWLPLNKNLWTSSYVVFTAGAALVCLAICSALIDLWGRDRWARPFEHYGWNSIALFVGSGLLARILLLIAWSGELGQRITLKSWLYQQLTAFWLPPRLSSLLFALATVALWWGVAAWLYRRRIFIKV